MDTESEVHGITEELKPAPYGGIEVMLPLVDGIKFTVNDTQVTPKALGALITILPGDIHHHVKLTGDSPAFVFISAGFDIKRGVKTDNSQFMVPGFANIKRVTELK